jgi:hypothetical protein
VRKTASFRRTAGRKTPRSITLIVCEGETERAYFQAIRVHYRLGNAEVIVAEGNDSAPISVVEHAEHRCAEPGGYDKVFCVFDRDSHESFQRACDRVRSLATRTRNPLPIDTAVSIPCFELWLLLHFERTDAPFHRCEDVAPRLREWVPKYVKVDAETLRPCLERLPTALSNADWLAQRAVANNSNPYTSVQRVLQHFAAVAKEA